MEPKIIFEMGSKEKFMSDNKNQTIFRCTDCDREFTSLSDLKEHKKSQEHDDCCVAHHHKTTLDEVMVKKNAPLRNIKWESKMVTVFLGVLIFIMLVQTAQAFVILNNLKGGGGSVAAQTTSSKPQGSAPLPSSIQNLPNMVGGC